MNNLFCPHAYVLIAHEAINLFFNKENQLIAFGMLLILS